MSVQLRVKVRRVASDTDDCRVRRAVVERLHPNGKRWISVGPDNDPVADHERDEVAHMRAMMLGLGEQSGYARNIDGRDVWISSYVEGETETPLDDMQPCK